MNRRTFDVLVPLGYAMAIMIAVFLGDGRAVGAVAAIGAFGVAAYYAALRNNLKQ